MQSFEQDVDKQAEHSWKMGLCTRKSVQWQMVELEGSSPHMRYLLLTSDGCDLQMWEESGDLSTVGQAKKQ